MSRPIQSRTVVLGFIFACLAIAWVGVGTYWSTHRLVLSYDSVARSHQAIEKLQSVQLLLEAAQTSAFGYVISGREERLDVYRRADRLIPRRIREIETLVKDHPTQKKALRQFSRLLAVHQRYLSKIVAERQENGYEAAAGWVAAEDDRSIREVLGGVLEEVKKEENKTLRNRSASAAQLSKRAKAALLGAAAVSLLLMAWIFSLLRRETGERHVVETTNQRLEIFLRSMVEHIPYMVLVKEANTLRITLANKAATEWLGLSEKDLLGSNDYDLRPREAAQIAMEQDREALRMREPVDIPEEVLTLEGKEERILHTQKVAIPDELGVPAHLLIISEDITQRKHAERILARSRDAAVQAERLKSEFIRNMSHEIRTPLSIVVGMTSILMDSELSPEQRAFGAKLQLASNNLVSLTKGILNFSKIESGTFALEMREMNLRENIEAVLAMLRQQAKAKGIGLVCLIPETLPRTLIGDAVRLRPVITELISNALKFTSRGEIIIRVQEEKQDHEQIWVTIKVSDTGVGIAEDVQEHLFEPFHQGDGSPTRRFGGTGLGLAISKRIVELMGGTIGFSSALNEGSVFWCTIPFKKRGTEAPHMVQVNTLPWTRSRVLVIDENEVVRQQLRAQLGSWGLASEGAASGEAALNLLRREKKAGRAFPIALLDLHLADVEGVAFARSVRADAELSATHLIVMTEKVLDRSTAESLGFSAAVVKPLKTEELYERLADLIESHPHAPRSSAEEPGKNIKAA